MSKVALNYVWIHYVRPDGGFEREMPCYQLKNMCVVAERYPDIDRYLWVDFQRLDHAEEWRLRASVQDYGVVLRDLREMPSYNSEAIFDVVPWPDDPVGKSSHGASYHPYLGHRSSIWRQVDWARILVLKHCLDDLLYDEVFYADFDLVDIRLSDSGLRSIFNEYGMVFSTIAFEEEQVENSFMGFNRSSKEFFEEYLLPDTRKKCVEEASNGYSGLLSAIRRYQPFSSSDLAHLSVPMEEVVREPIGFE